MSPADLLKYSKETIDRLQEISPLIPPEVLKDFRRRFARETDIAKPEEANGLEKIDVYEENPPRIRRASSAGMFVQSPSVDVPELRLHQRGTSSAGGLHVRLP